MIRLYDVNLTHVLLFVPTRQSTYDHIRLTPFASRNSSIFNILKFMMMVFHVIWKNFNFFYL